MKGLMRKLSSKDLPSPNDIVECAQAARKQPLAAKRSLSLESIHKLINHSEENLKRVSEPKRTLSKSFSMRIRKKSDSVVRRQTSIQPEFRQRKTSILPDSKQRKVSAQPNLSIGNVVIPSEKRVRKGSVQPHMMMGRRPLPSKKDMKARKLSVPANMKYHSERVRVRKVSFVNQSTGLQFQMAAETS